MGDILLTPPLSDETIARLRAGDRVLISGEIYTARDSAHKRLVELLEREAPLPFPLQGQIIYYVGPTPAPPGRPIGSCGPTTSSRMDVYTPRLLQEGLKAMIGKGPRSSEVILAMKNHRAIYFAAIGGAGALIARCVKKAEIIAYEDLGPEAVRRLTVERMPVIVINDVYGNDLYRQVLSAEDYAAPK